MLQIPNTKDYKAIYIDDKDSRYSSMCYQARAVVHDHYLHQKVRTAYE
jgi:hypothetical protein